MAIECQHIILHYVATILIFVGIITPSWTTNWNTGSLKIQRGLSTICVKKICIDHNNNPEVKYLVFAGFYLSIFCDLVVTLHFILKSLSITAVKFLPKMAFVVGIIGAILIIIGSIMYAVDNFGDKKYPGYSYGFLVSGGLILMSAATASSRVT